MQLRLGKYQIYLGKAEGQQMLLSDDSSDTSDEPLTAQLIRNSLFQQRSQTLQTVRGDTPQVAIEDRGFKAMVQALQSRQALAELYSIVYAVTELRYAVFALRRGVFRRGIDVAPKFVRKCTSCQTEFKTDIAVCEQCGAATRIPDIAEKNILEDLLKSVNSWSQSLTDVLAEVEDDVNIADDGFILIPRMYILAPDGMVFSKVLDIVRHDPCAILYDLDDTGIPGHKRGACRIHRDIIISYQYNDYHEVIAGSDLCPYCNLQVEPIMYEATFRTGRVLLFNEEVIHWSKYSPSKLYGFSPVLTTLERALSVAGADRNLYRIFYQRKLPRGMVVTVTTDVNGFKAERSLMQERMSSDPEYVPWLIIRDTAHGKPSTEWIKLGDDPTGTTIYPMLLNTLRTSLPMLWGVTLPGGGGASGTHQTATNSMNDYQVHLWAIEDTQQIYNTKVFPLLATAWGIQDWKLSLLLPEERLEEMRITRIEKTARVATLLWAMGFTITLDDDNSPEWSGQSKENPAFSAGAQPGATPPMGASLPSPAGGGMYNRDINGMASLDPNAPHNPDQPMQPQGMGVFNTLSKSLLPEPDVHPGAMIAFLLDSSSEQTLIDACKPLKTTPDHLTLVYLSAEAADIEHAKNSVIASISALAVQTPPLNGYVNGYGRFAGDADSNESPIYANFDSPALPELRQALLDIAYASGCVTDDSIEHGFTPHITLTYLDKSKKTPNLLLPSLEITFDRIALVWAGETMTFPLTGVEDVVPTA